MREEDLTGKKFGRLTVLKREDDYISPKGRKTRRWLCECECGKRKIICANSLKSGQTQSCGCLRNERIKEATYTVNNTSNNEVRYEGNIVHVRLSNSEKEMICYASDWEKLKNRTWRLTANGYAKTTIRENKIKKTIPAHKIIMDAKDGEIVDHINRNRLDNRKDNLRIVNYKQNGLHKKLHKGNISGYAGVSKNKTEWLAHITKDGKWSLIGKYGTKNEAIKARKEKEIELYGINSQ